MTASGIDLVISGAGRLAEVGARPAEPFAEARRLCIDRLGARDIAVHVVEAPDECIPGWGLGGTAWGPHAVVLAVDPRHELGPERVVTTLVHEIHHAIRWRGPGCGSSLRERLVSEGLTSNFERECTGRFPEIAQGPVDETHRRAALDALDQDPADDGAWFFGAAEVPRWFGYRLGHRLVGQALAARGTTAAASVHEPASRFC